MSDAQPGLGFWRTVPAIAIGVMGGVFVLIALRVQYYELMGLQPNMAPQMACYFSPLILAIVLAVALPLGAFPVHWPIVLVANPVLLRWALGLTFRSGA